MNRNIRNLISQPKNHLFSIAIIVLVLILTKNSFKNQINKIESFKAKIELEKKKNEKLLFIDKLTKKFESLKKMVNNKDLSKIINRVGDLAKSSSVTIISIRPLDETMSGPYVKHSFGLAIVADSFHSIGKFISKLENHSDIFMIESLSIRLGSEGKRGQVQVMETSNIVADLKLTTILVMD